MTVDIDHNHCPCDCEHPQPFMATKTGDTVEREWCGKCWHDDKVLCEMIPCSPITCPNDYPQPSK